MRISSTVIQQGSEIPTHYTSDGEDTSPELSWQDFPDNTQSFVLIVHDPDAPRPGGFTHWVLYNIPSTTTALPQNVPTDAHLENGAAQGKNVRGSAGYIGPKPPAGQTHPYHFEVFAVNTRLNLDPANADRNAVVNAMKNHVLASGEVVANYTGK